MRAPSRATRRRTRGFVLAGFTRAQRIRKRDEFVVAQRRGAPARGRHAVVLVSVRADAGPARLGVVASRKVGSAVHRNRSKRLVREWFRSASLPSGLDVVVIAHATLAEAAAADVTRDLDGTLSRARAKLGPRRHRTDSGA